MSRSADVTFLFSAFPTTTRGTQYSSMGGFVIEYLAETTAVSGTDYLNAPDGIQTRALFFTLSDFETPPQQPGMAKSDVEVIPGPAYDQNITQFFWPSSDPESDPGESGLDDDISRFVVFNANLDSSTLCDFDLKQPAFSNNPPFRQGSTVRVQFTCKNGPVPGLVAYLSVEKVVDGTPQPVVSRNQIGNKFSSGAGGNNFTYELHSLFLDLGTHRLIITSNGFAPIDGVPATDPQENIFITVEP
jgi:hypothetical protein